MDREPIAVLIPALNEERTVYDVVRGVPREVEGVPVKIVVIDDGSTDRTVEKAREAGAEVVSHHRRLGVGAAFHTGIVKSLRMGARAVVTIDGDGQFNPRDIPKLVAPILHGEADMVTASRFMKAEIVPEMRWSNKWGNRRMANLISILAGQKFFDVACGFRAYSQRAVASLNLTGKFTYTQEVFLSLAFRDFYIKEIPICVRGTRQFGESRVARSLFRYAVQTLMIIFRCYRDYKPMRFFGTIAGSLICLGVLFWAFLAWHYWTVGSFTPHIWSGFTGGFFIGFGLLISITGLMADMLDRIRMGIEETLSVMRTGANGLYTSSERAQDEENQEPRFKTVSG